MGRLSDGVAFRFAKRSRNRAEKEIDDARRRICLTMSKV